MNNLNVPPASVCSSDGFRVVVYAAALQTECNFTSQVFSNSDSYEEYLGSSNSNKTRCSIFSNESCISVNKHTMWNFTSGPPFSCNSDPTGEWDCPPGAFAIIFGTWITKDVDADRPPIRMYTVDCPVSFGNVTIVQNGQSPPTLDRGSFAKSKATLLMENEMTEQYNSTTRNSTDYTVWYWQASYLGYQEFEDSSSPYTFDYTNGGGQTIDPLARYLLIRPNSTIAFVEDASIVAKAIEDTFDVATLFAFQRAPEAAMVETTLTNHVYIWSYDPRVLAILTPPLIATILVLGTRWRIYSNNIVIGYSPLAIAERAEEILALSPTTSEHPSRRLNDSSELSMGNYETVPGQQGDVPSLVALESLERRPSSETLHPMILGRTTLG